MEDTSGSHGKGASGKVVVVRGRHASGVVAELFDLAEFFLVAEPVLVAADAPVGKVLGGDKLASELGGEDRFYGSKVVEPGEDGGGRLAIEKALVELFADVAGEAGDFAASGGKPWWMGEIFFRHAGSLAGEAENR